MGIPAVTILVADAGGGRGANGGEEAFPLLLAVYDGTGDRPALIASFAVGLLISAFLFRSGSRRDVGILAPRDIWTCWLKEFVMGLMNKIGRAHV